MKDKSLLFTALIATCFLLLNCKKTNSDSTPKLSVTGIADTTIIDTLSSIYITSNMPASLSLNKPEGGSLNDAEGKYKSGGTEGIYTLTIKNNADTNDQLKKIIVVTHYADLFNDVKNNGGYVLSFRHANASYGSDHPTSTEPEWWKSCDSTLARQLTPGIGKEQSDTTGWALKALGFKFDTIMSSVFCRCVQTAEHFNPSLPIRQYEELSQVYDEPNRYTKTMNLYASKPVVSKLNYLAVTHAGFTVHPDPAPLATLNWGDCAIFKLNGIGVQPAYITTVKINYWISLGKK